MRQLLIFERFLVRLRAGFADRIVTKGGLALEMRLSRARTTKDLDLRLSGDAASLKSDLNAAAASDQSDWLVFSVRPDAAHPKIERVVLEHFLKRSLPGLGPICQTPAH
jgi:predicted nucleotidyltransferase component of viral defense system